MRWDPITRDAGPRIARPICAMDCTCWDCTPRARLDMREAALAAVVVALPVVGLVLAVWIMLPR